MTPCKISKVVDEINTFQVNAADLPVSLTIVSDPTSCQFKIAQIDIYAGDTKVDSKPGINDTTAKLPPTAGKILAKGAYNVYVVPSPAAGAPTGNPYNGGPAQIKESCDGKTWLLFADANYPMPYFILKVV